MNEKEIVRARLSDIHSSTNKAESETPLMGIKGERHDDTNGAKVHVGECAGGFIVYKASAGSGKTFTLAVEILSLLVKDPCLYDKVLAVTFTNKATGELKRRILGELYGLSRSLKESDVYLHALQQATGLDEMTIRDRARIALEFVINRYHSFHVETIDSFFQGVVRDLSSELDLPSSLRLGLNDYEVEEEAVDQLVNGLERGGWLFGCIMDYIGQRMDEERGWDVVGGLKHFGRNIFNIEWRKEKDSGKNAGEVHEEVKGMLELKKELLEIKRKAKARMSRHAESIEHALERNNLCVTDFAKGELVLASYLQKLRGDDWSDKKCLTKTLAGYLQSAENWSTKRSAKREQIIEAAERELIPLLEKVEESRHKEWCHVSSANVTLRHLHELRLLWSIENEVKRLNAASNRFLLSDTPWLLGEMIKGSDAPFIYEKTGTHFSHIMIDEMQDTSRLQWKNFKVLIEEVLGSLGTGRVCLVGDVKQSIYRWRGGDWRLLNELCGSGEIRTLKQNWRSKKNVIDFNNAFFSCAPKLDYIAEIKINKKKATEVLEAYDDVVQTVPNKAEKEGYVRVTLLPNNDDDRMLEELGHHVEELLSNGHCLRDIAILLRAKKHIPIIANYFMKTYNIAVVSDEAFFLDASPAVVKIVNALRILVNPNDKLAHAIVESGEVGGTIDNTLLSTISADKESLLLLPLSEICEELYHRLSLHQLKGQDAYLATFFDVVNSFVEEHGSDIVSFLSSWDKSLHEKTTQGVSMDGIRLLSIHKAKGLEFKHVLLPFMDWQLEKNDQIIWCKPTVAPFNVLPVVPVRYSSKLLDTIYSSSYEEEHLQNTIDNLNLLYVAFTRARNNLFIIGRRDGIKGFRSALIQETLNILWEKHKSGGNEDVEYLADLRVKGLETEEEPLVYEYGQMSQECYPTSEVQRETHEDDANSDEVNVFKMTERPLALRIETFPNAIEFRQSTRSKEFVEELEDVSALPLAKQETQKQAEYIRMGNLMHKVFSMIRTTDDVSRVLKQLEFEGLLFEKSISMDTLCYQIKQRLESPNICKWFHPRWQLFRECSILSTDVTGKLIERRPDRVMTDGSETIVVDFKFGVPRDRYKEQVAQYVHLLQNMGMPSVKGFLWYVYQNKVEEV